MNDRDDDHHTLDTVVQRLCTAHNSVLVVTHDEQTEHIGYWDKSQRLVDTGALAYLQQQDFSIIYAGTKTCNQTGHKQAWVEARRRDPNEVYPDA